MYCSYRSGLRCSFETCSLPNSQHRFASHRSTRARTTKVTYSGTLFVSHAKAPRYALPNVQPPSPVSLPVGVGHISLRELRVPHSSRVPFLPPRVRRPLLLRLRVQSKSAPPSLIRTARPASLFIFLAMSFSYFARTTFATSQRPFILSSCLVLMSSVPFIGASIINTQ